MNKRHGQLEAVSALEPRGRPVITASFEQNEVCDTFRISYLANRLVIPIYDEIESTG